MAWGENDKIAGTISEWGQNDPINNNIPALNTEEAEKRAGEIFDLATEEEVSKMLAELEADKTKKE